MPNPWDENWTLNEKLGKGGQGTTHLAVRKTDSVIGVLKKLLNNKSLPSRARMHREAANLQVLNAIYDAG